MKLNKKISKFLVLGLLTNNIYFNSSANTDIPNRYETLEGEYITIDDSMEGNLEEIEIFGNTVQDPNNLEDIQSVGDLYVDENGNPILDSQGREQYKIDIVSSNSNLNYNNKFYAKSIGTFSVVDNGYKVENTHNQVHICYDIPLNGNTQVTVKAKLIENSSNYNNSNATLEWWVDDKWGGQRIQFIDNELNHVVKSSKITSDSKVLTLRIGIGKNDFDYGYAVFDDISLAYGDTTHLDFEEPLESRTTILLPCQLQKVGDVADRLYWDNEKGKYIVEKNIEKINLKDYEYTYNRSATDWISPDGINYGGPSRVYTFNLDVDSYLLNLKYNGFYSTNILRPTNESMLYNGFHNDDGRAVNRLGLYGGGCYVRVEDSIAGNTTEDFLNWIKNANISFYSTRTSPLLIETNITSKLKIPIYNNKTYIYIESNNATNPVLKVIIDRLPQIARDAVLEAENNSTSYNISLARMYVNMLPESLYKDQLQEQLSQVFSSDITLDRESASSNLDVYVKSENMLSISLDTNSVTFEEYSGAEPIEKLNAVNITINSSLPYDLNAYMPIEITNADGSSTIDFDILNIKESSETDYKQFINATDKVVLKSDCAKGNGNIHNIDLKLDSNAAHKADVYKTVIKFEAEQK